MTQLTEEHFELHSTNKARSYQEQKIIYLQDRVDVLEKSLGKLQLKVADMVTWIDTKLEKKKTGVDNNAD